jgi:hypothetical protein
MAQLLAAQTPAQQPRFGPGLVRFHLAQSPPGTAWTIGQLLYVWNSDWGNAVCIRFMAEPPGRDSVTLKIPQLDSLEVAVDSAGHQLRARQAQSPQVVWVPYLLGALRRADVSCPEP